MVSGPPDCAEFEDPKTLDFDGSKPSIPRPQNPRFCDLKTLDFATSKPSIPRPQNPGFPTSKPSISCGLKTLDSSATSISSQSRGFLVTLQLRIFFDIEHIRGSVTFCGMSSLQIVSRKIASHERIPICRRSPSQSFYSVHLEETMITPIHLRPIGSVFIFGSFFKSAKTNRKNKISIYLMQKQITKKCGSLKNDTRKSKIPKNH